MALLEAKNITKIYQDKNSIPVTALNNVNLQIEAGEFVAIAGPSGSGKSTLLNLFGGLDKPTGGIIEVDGNDLAKMSKGELAEFRLRKLGFIFQAYNLIPVLTAEENAEFTMLLQGVEKSERHSRVISELDELGIEETLLDRRPAELSGGQQQRIAVARATVARPKLILADEPTANLDSKTAKMLLDKMRDMNEKTGITFVFSTHDQLVMDYAKRLVQIRDGEIAGDIKQNKI